MNVILRSALGFTALCSSSLPLGCSQSERPARTAVIDSAGVQVVENSQSLWKPGEGWKLSAEPVLEIGVDVGDPAYEFGNAHGPVRLSDGRIAVADMQSNQIRFYDARGKFLSSVGRSGRGPGEFEQLYRLRKIDGDSLMALDPATPLLTSIFAPGGKFVRRFDLAAVPNRGNLWWLGRLSNGVLLAISLQREGTRELAPPKDPKPGEEYPTFVTPERPENYRDSLMHFLFTMEGELIDSIGKLPGQWLSEMRVFAPNAAYAFFGDVFYHSPGDVIEIRRFRALSSERATATPMGKQLLVRLDRIIRSPPLRDLAVTEQDKEVYFFNERERFRRIVAQDPRFDPSGLERRLAATKFPPSIPAHANRMYADALGNVWLQEYRIGPQEPYRWSIFDSEGRWLGTVESPPEFTVNEIGADYVIGIWRDEFDVQQVRMYRLEKS